MDQIALYGAAGGVLQVDLVLPLELRVEGVGEGLDAPVAEGAALGAVDGGEVRAHARRVVAVEEDPVRVGVDHEHVGVSVLPLAALAAELAVRRAALRLQQGGRSVDEGDQLLGGGRPRRRFGRGVRGPQPVAAEEQREPNERAPDSELRRRLAHAEPPPELWKAPAYDRRGEVVKVCGVARARADGIGTPRARCGTGGASTDGAWWSAASCSSRAPARGGGIAPRPSRCPSGCPSIGWSPGSRWGSGPTRRARGRR